MKSRQSDVIMEQYYLPLHVCVGLWCTRRAQCIEVQRSCELQQKLCHVNPVHIPLLCTLQGKNIRWNLAVTISLIANSLNLNSAYNEICTSLAMIVYVFKVQKCKKFCLY